MSVTITVTRVDDNKLCFSERTATYRTVFNGTENAERQEKQPADRKDDKHSSRSEDNHKQQQALYKEPATSRDFMHFL